MKHGGDSPSQLFHFRFYTSQVVGARGIFEASTVLVLFFWDVRFCWVKTWGCESTPG